MDVRRAAVGLFKTGGLTIALAISLLSQEARGQQPGRLPQVIQQRPIPPVKTTEYAEPAERPQPAELDKDDNEDVNVPSPPPRPESSASNDLWKRESDSHILYAHFRATAFDTPQLMVNSKRIGLQYEVRNAGPSGVSEIEVWQTREGKMWEKIARASNQKPPFIVEVPGEGMYGFTLIPRSGVGLAQKAPAPGDLPQMWVEVDLTPPDVKLKNIIVGSGRDTGKLTINWSAQDKNLGADAITLSYAEGASSTWLPIASRIRNTGTYVWQMPEKTPYRFLVRVHAVDKAGNVGSAQTPEPVIVDLATPESVILRAEPVGR
jgi:hypothetical protein